MRSVLDRQITYTGALIPNTTLLGGEKAQVVAQGALAKAILGASTVIDGLVCSPSTPASLSVIVGSGSIYSLQTLDATAYGELGTDSALVVKQGTLPAAQTLTLTAPTTSGYSQTYLVQAAFLESDTGSTVLPYYNSTQPAQPFAGPANSGISQNTVRQDRCVVSLLAGTAATTGSQVTPTATAGYAPLYTITLVNGQTTITSANIVIVSGAPIIPVTLPNVPLGVQAGQWVSFVAGGSATAYTGTLNPIPASLTPRMEVLGAFATANSGTSPTLNLNGLGALPILKQGGGAPAAGDISGFMPLVLNTAGSAWVINGLVPSDIASVAPIKAPGPITLYVRTDGSDTNTGLTNTSAGAFKTFLRAYTYLVQTYSSGFTATIQAGIPGTYAGLVATNIGIASNIMVSGDTASGYPNAANYILTPVAYGDGTSGCCLSSINGVSLVGFTCDSSSLGAGTSGAIVRAGTGGNLALYGVTLKYSGTNTGIQMMQEDVGGVLALDGPVTVTGGGSVGNIISSAGNFAAGLPMTFTMSGMTFGNFISVTNGIADLSGITFAGSGNTGQQFNVIDGRMNPPSAGLSAIPGSTSGYVVQGGGAYVPGYLGASWTTTTLNVTVTSGTLSSATCTARYQRNVNDKTIKLYVSLVLGTYSGSGSAQIQLPAALIPQSGINLLGRESAVTGKSVATSPTAAAGLLNLNYADNTATAATGANFQLQGTYEALT